MTAGNKRTGPDSWPHTAKIKKGHTSAFQVAQGKMLVQVQTLAKGAVKEKTI